MKKIALLLLLVLSLSLVSCDKNTETTPGATTPPAGAPTQTTPAPSVTTSDDGKWTDRH